MKKKVLVTGGTGYIGSHTLIDLIENGYDVVSSLLAIEKITGVKVPYFHIDLCDLSGAETIFKSHPDIQGVIHFAALKAVGESVEKPIQYFRNNIDSLINTLDLCLKYDVKAFIFSVMYPQVLWTKTHLCRKQPRHMDAPNR